MATKAATPQVTETKQQTKAWEPAAPLLQTQLDAAMKAFNLTNNNAYNGQYLAGPNDVQTQAAQNALTKAPGFDAGASEVRNLALDTISGNYLTPESNPALKGAMEAAWAPIQRDLTNTILPGINDKAIAEGAWGGARQDIQQNLAVADAIGRGSEATSKIAYDNYTKERANQLSAATLLPQANQLDLQPSQVQSTVGGVMQGWDQLALDEAFQHYSDSQNAPWFGIDKLASVSNPLAQTYGTTTGTSSVTPSTPSFNPLSGGIQGGLGGLSTMATLASVIPGLQPFTMPLMLAGLAGGSFAGARR